MDKTLFEYNDFRIIRFDLYNYLLQEKRDTKKGLQWVDNGYYSNFLGALTSLKRKINNKGKKVTSEIKSLLDAFHLSLDESLTKQIDSLSKENYILKQKLEKAGIKC